MQSKKGWQSGEYLSALFVTGLSTKNHGVWPRPWRMVYPFSGAGIEPRELGFLRRSTCYRWPAELSLV